MMRRYSFNARRTLLALVATLVASLGVAASASQAIVVSDNGTEAGVALAPGARGVLPTGVSAATGPASCTDPWLAADLGGPSVPNYALCYGGGAVMHKNETFALTWDQPRAYWALTRGYVEQFLRDVADSSGSLDSPFAVTTQYNDSGGRAQNASIFGGGCIDYGTTGGADCEYGSPTGTGHNYPGNDCSLSGDSFVTPTAVTANTVCLTDADLKGEVATMVSQTGILGRTQPGYTPLVTLLMPPTVKVCLDAAGSPTVGKLCSVNGNLTPPPPNVTSADTGTGKIPAGTYQVVIAYNMGGTPSAPSVARTVTTSSSNTEDSSITITAPPSATGATGWNVYVTQNGGTTYTLQASGTDFTTPIVLDNLTTTGASAPHDQGFCSYHSQVNVGGTEVAYVVQPWNAGTECDEPDAPVIPQNPTPQQMAVGVGQRLVSPLSQSMVAAISDPGLNGWLGRDATEIDDNAGCIPVGNGLDKVTLGTSGQNPYYLQRETNNAGALEFDPATYFGCAPQVDLMPQFVVPSAVNQGDEVQFDGSATDSTLIVPNAGYSWSFGDGATATGPSVVHSYANGGTYNVKLTVTDRGGNVSTLSQQIQVLGSDGQPVLPPAQTPTTSPSPAPGSGSPGSALLNARLQLLPQSLKAVLRNGIAVRVSSNKAANGIATVWIPRAVAKKAHIKVGKAPSVRIGLGTVSSITNGTVTLRLHLSRAVAQKLSRLKHLTLSVRLALVAPGSQQVAIDVAGRY